MNKEKVLKLSRKPKILVDAHVFDGPYQGTRTFLKGLYSAWSHSESVDLYLAAHNVDNLAKEFEGCDGIEFIALKSKRGLSRLGVEFPCLAYKYNFDYIHYQYMDAAFKTCKTIITTHDVLFLDYPQDFPFLYRQKKYLFKLAAKRADILTTVSDYSKGRIQKHLGVNLDEIHVLKEGIEPLFFKSFDKKSCRDKVEKKYSAANYILYVGRIEPRKNHHALLQAYLELELWKVGKHLVFIGVESIVNPRFNELMENLPCEAKQFIHQLSGVGFEDLCDFLVGSDLFVYPSLAEGFGLPPLEAAAMKVETLLSNTSSMKEFDFFGNRFFDPYNVEELKEKMLGVLLNSTSFPRMTDISHIIERDYDWSQCAGAMESLVFENF